jgi:membrane protein
MLQTIRHFFSEGIWLINPDELPRIKALIIRYLKIIILATQGFIKDHCALRASALTLYTLLSIVPIIAMLFGIAKGFGFEKKLREQIIEHVPDQDSMIMQVIEFAENLLATTKGGLVAGIGIAVLFWTVVRVISNIESSFNHIWKIRKGRAVSRKLSDYLSLMVLAPILLIVSGSISVFVSTQITKLIEIINLPDLGTFLVVFVLKFLPLLLLWTLFSFTFIFMPNTKVSFKSGVIAGVLAGTIYKIVQWGYVSLQLGVTSINAIYGSFAALPLFLIWLQIGWMIVLFGSEISFFEQNYDSYRNKDKFANLSFSKKKVLALQVSQLVISQFSNNQAPLTLAEICTKLVLPISVIQPIMDELTESKIISEMKVEEGEEPTFQPACDTSLLTIAYVIDALEKCGNNTLPNTEGYDYFSKIIEEFEGSLVVSANNKLLKDIENIDVHY